MNASLSQFWGAVNSKFDALNKRERWLVFGASTFVAYSLVNALFLSPVLAKKKILSGEVSADQAQIQALQQQITVMNSQEIIDPDAQNKQLIANLQANIQSIDSKLEGMQSSLISPDKIPELLRSLLKKNGKLKLIELKTMPATGLLESPQAQNNTTTTSPEFPETAPSIINKTIDGIAFKHGVEITVEGRYLDLLDYVSQLENTSWHILWSKAALTTEHPPVSQLKLTVYTLSLDKTWLSI
ncbi:MAG: MSHA biogenesis protein MshJ [Methylotenera sp.]|nr:MSHA biogenesis protein MshJ [Methylotenera sp.]